MPSTIPLPGTREHDLEKTEETPLFARNHNLILWNDDVTPVMDVINALIRLLGYPPPQSVAKVAKIERLGKDIVFSGTLEVCELRHEQFGSLGLTTTIESTDG